MSKLIKSGIANWGVINPDDRIEDGELFIKTIMVDGGVTMKRLRTAPQGRGYRIRKRSNHVTVIIDSIKNNNNETEA